LLFVTSLLIVIVLSIKRVTRRQIIYLAPFRGITPAQTRQVAKALVALYGQPTAVLPVSILPDAAICRVRQRYQARAVLNFLASHIPTPDDVQAKVLAFSVADIEIEVPPQKPHWGVLGLTSEIGGDQGIVSTFRLQGRTDRLVKVSLHEAGHMLHLPHCTSNTPTCLMNDAQGKVATVDAEHLFLCRQCKSALRW
jgi:predicted Zn-dependent protease